MNEKNAKPEQDVKPAKARLEGVEVELNGVTFVAPPLNFKALKRLLPNIQTLPATGALTTEADVMTAVDVVWSALARNYPEMTIDDVLDGLDMRNVQKILPAGLGQSGLVEKK